MANYNHQEIEEKWQKYWKENKVYQVEKDSNKPKYYVLDMFPYPSGAGLHVGHPLGYIASDIVTRFKKLKGFNVLHPMGFDSFGLPAEQYAIDTGQHPAITTEKNIETFKNQLAKIGFSFDWSREVQTSSPDFYRWTQWIFQQIFNAWYNLDTNKAESIEGLITKFEEGGNSNVNAVCDDDAIPFSAEEWKAFSEVEKQKILLDYRLTYPSEAMVNWCPGLGTVLANDEVKEGFSERGGYPVERKKMKQWMMRITAFADRLASNLDTIDWSDSLKEMQRNWIGKSLGCELDFQVVGKDITLTAFTTRPDTIYGVTYVVLAPEHELVSELTTEAQKAEVASYVNTAKNRSERERMADVKTVSGVFTGSYVKNPISGEEVPLWVADYVLAGYGTGVVMAVPSSDDRDFRFAKYFNLPIRRVIEGTEEMEDPTEKKDGKLINSDFLNGLYGEKMHGEGTGEAVRTTIAKAEELGVGTPKVNYKMRDAVFSRQRYWGEPVPVYFDENDVPHLVPKLPLELPSINEYKPTATGEPPLGRATDWKYEGKYNYELTTMPGWAGSSWYSLRYMDAQNDGSFVSKEAVDYWKSVDLYIGGTEHAVGHLLYSRFWNLFLYDMGFIPEQEPFKKLVNQGMIQGVSQKIYIQQGSDNTLIFPSKQGPINFTIGIDTVFTKFYSADYVKNWDEDSLKKQSISNSHYVPINHVQNNELDISSYMKEWRTEVDDAIFHCKSGVYFYSKNHDAEFLKQIIRVHIGEWETIAHKAIKVSENLLFIPFNFFKEPKENEIAPFYTTPLVEKMSKSKYNVVNPDDVIAKHGADTLRMYEMFLGPLEASKPWNTDGIDGVSNFLRKLWRLFFDNEGNLSLSDEKPTKDELKTLHKTIKKVEEDIENLSLNTSVSAFMVCVNELKALKCNKKEILQDLVVTLSPFAPHIAEELWQFLGNESSITQQTFPQWNEAYLKEDTYEYPISVNGKVRAKMSFAIDMDKQTIEEQVLASDVVQKWLDGKTPKRVIVVPKRIVNVVV